MEFLHIFVNIFAGGRSEVKVYLFLVYFSTILILFICRRLKLKAGSFTSEKVLQKVFFVSISVLFAMGVAAQVVLVNDLHTGLMDRVVVYNNNDVSATSMYHIHTMKGAMALLLTPFVQEQVVGVDIGNAFTGLYPNYFFVFAIIILFAAIVSSLGLFWKKVRHTHQNKGVWFAVAYAIFAFSILKNTIDGGLFNIETIPALLSMYLLLSYEKKTKHHFVFGFLTFTAILLIALEIILVYRENVVQTPFSIPHLIGACTLFACLLYIQVENKTKLYNTLFLLVFISGMYIATERGIDDLQYAETIVNKGSMVMVYSAFPVDVAGLELRSQILDFRFYRGNIREDIKVRSIIEATRVPANFRSVAISGQTCGLFGEQHGITFDISVGRDEPELVTQNFLGKQNTYFSIKNIEPYADREENDLSKYKVTASLSKCLTRELDVIEKVFKEQGYQTFIVSHIEAIQ